MAVIRVMTYNVHSCIGRDLRHDLQRIARVIEAHEPDIVALQELDIRHKLPDGLDQPMEIARYLEMDYHFHPSIKVAEGQYGNAILSRYPFKKIAARQLPPIKEEIKLTRIEKWFRFAFEPRGIIWTQLDVNGTPVQVLTTHLGLITEERKIQMAMIRSSQWLNAEECAPPVIFLGDFNDTPRSQLYKTLTVQEGFRDAQASAPDHRRSATFFSGLPWRCLDHIFVKGVKAVRSCTVPWNKLTRLASDHLPVIADIEL